MNNVRIQAKIEIVTVDHMNASDIRPEMWFINGFLNEGKQKLKFVYVVNDAETLERFKKEIDSNEIYDMEGNITVKIRAHEFVYINLIKVKDMDGNLMFD